MQQIRGCLLLLEWGLLFWLEVRFPVGAEYGLRAVACCCASLDREEGHNWYLFSLRDTLLEPVTRRRKEEARYSLKCYHFSFAGISAGWVWVLLCYYLSCGSTSFQTRQRPFYVIFDVNLSAQFCFTGSDEWWIIVHYYCYDKWTLAMFVAQ